MEGHTTEEQIRQYRERTLAPQERDSVLSHLAACPACRERAMPTEEMNVAMAGLYERLYETEMHHLEPEAMLRYVRQEVIPAERAEAEEHLEACPLCRAELDDLLAFRTEQSVYPPKAYAPGSVFAAPNRRHTRAWWSLGGIAAAACAVVLILFRTPAPQHRTAEAPQPVPPQILQMPRPVSRQRPKPQAPRPSPREPVRKPVLPATAPARTDPPPTGTVPGSATAPRPKAPAPLRRLLAALPEPAAGMPAWAKADLQQAMEPPPVSRGASPTGAAGFLLEPDPRNSVVEEVRPSFRWQPVEGATGYAVHLTAVPEDVEAPPREVESATTGTASFQPKTLLARSGRYILRVQPVDPEGTDETDPMEWRFRVLSETEAVQAAWAQAHAEAHPVTAAMTLYRLGLVSEAAALTGRWPDDHRLDAWKAFLQETYTR